MRQIRVTYHHEDNSWWADSADVDGFTALSDSYSDLRQMVGEGLNFYLGDEKFELREFLDDGALLLTEVSLGSLSSDWYSRRIAYGIPTASSPTRDGMSPARAPHFAT